MVMATKKPGTGEYIITESGPISRDKITLYGGDFLAGTLLGKATATEKYTQWDPSASDGTEVAAAVLYAAVDASESDQQAVANTRLAELDDQLIIYPEAATPEEIAVAHSDLATAHLIVR